MLTLLSTLFGGLLRAIPEVLSHLDKKNEREQELKLLNAQLELEQTKADRESASFENNISMAELEAMSVATKTQAKRTGIKWVDALNALIRPLLAIQWLILLYPSVIIAGFILSVQGGVPALEALHGAFDDNAQYMVASIASFWLVDRSFRKIFGAKK